MKQQIEALKTALTALITIGEQLADAAENDEEGASAVLANEALFPLAQIRAALTAAGVPEAEINQL